MPWTLSAAGHLCRRTGLHINTADALQNTMRKMNIKTSKSGLMIMLLVAGDFKQSSSQPWRNHKQANDN